MNKSYYNLLFHRNLTNQSTIDFLTNIIRCKKCNKYNNIYSQTKNTLCIYCNNPILVNFR
jgi:late competence protein required for DNA uptake (superfamily II DNA/RNA helicase)